MTDDFFTDEDTRPATAVDDRLRSLVSQLVSGELDFESAITLFSGDFKEIFTDWLKEVSENGKEYLTWTPAKQTYYQLDKTCAMLIGHICTIRDEDAPLIKNPYNEATTIGAIRSLVIKSYNSELRIGEAQDMFAVHVASIYDFIANHSTIVGIIENGYNFEVALKALEDATYLIVLELSELSNREVVDVGDATMQGGVVGQGEPGSGDSPEPDSDLPVHDDNSTDPTS
jgi:hypothetical protein